MPRLRLNILTNNPLLATHHVNRVRVAALLGQRGRLANAKAPRRAGLATLGITI